MARLLAIDYGTKRCGIAVSDPLQIIANGLTTVHSKDILNFLETYFQKEAVEVIIVGDPKKLSGEATDATVHVNAFVKQLHKKFPEMKIERIDERFTSKMAFQTMIDSGLKKKARQNKELVDEISATIILQSYMEMKK
ncbi:MAG: Holliday junction resolvase RuvX [Bacteroidetes bacterium]|jgi:putative Holliday junction resolvase|nr:Holliday junction resolvase RuvX [Bacteroidota bacterium]